MLDEAILERRLKTLEKSVAELQSKLQDKPDADDWLQVLVGSISDQAAFAEALDYGRAFRQVDKPAGEDDLPE